MAGRAPIDPETGVTAQQERFAAEFIRTGKLNVAYRIAYNAEKMSDPSVWVEASRLADNPKVALRIEHYRKIAARKLEVTVERIALETARIAFFDPRELFDDDGNPIPIGDLPEDVARAIAGVDVDDLYEGSGKDRARVGVTKKYKLASKLPALELLARWKKMLSEGGGVKDDEFSDMTEEEIEREAKAAIAEGVKLGIVKVLKVDPKAKSRRAV